MKIVQLLVSSLMLSSILITAAVDDSNAATWFTACNQTVTCGEIGPLGFPFWGGPRPTQCGYPHLGIRCEGGRATLESNGTVFRVLLVDSDDSVVTLAREDYLDDGMCLGTYRNTTLDGYHFRYTPKTQDLTVSYGCQRPEKQLPGQFECSSGFGYYGYDAVHVDPRINRCNTTVVVPILSELESDISVTGLSNVISRGFEVEFVVSTADREICGNCPGTCGYNGTTVCLVPPSAVDADKSGRSKRRFVKVAVVVWGVSTALLVLLIVLHFAGVFVWIGQLYNRDNRIAPI